MRNSTSGSAAAVALPSSSSAASSCDERRGGVEIAAVGAEVHAGERDFLEAGRGDALDLAQQTCASGTLRGRAARRRE